MKHFRSLLSLVLVVTLFFFFLLVGYENSESVSLGLLDWRTPTVPVFYWIVGALALGSMMGFILAYGFGVRHRLEARRMRRALEVMERKLRSLRETAPNPAQD